MSVHNQAGDNLVDPHGTHTAGTAVGDRSTYGVAGTDDGNAFAAKIAHTDLCDLDPSECDFNLPAFVTLGTSSRMITTTALGFIPTAGATIQPLPTRQTAETSISSVMILKTISYLRRNQLSHSKTPENAKNVLAVAAKQAPNQNSSLWWWNRTNH